MISFDYEIFLKRFNALLDNDVRSDYEIAATLGVNRDVLSKYRKGVNRIKIDAVANIAQLYGVSTDYLLGLTNVSTSKLTTREICDATKLNEAAVNGLTALLSNDVPPPGFVSDYLCPPCELDLFTFQLPPSEPNKSYIDYFNYFVPSRLTTICTMLSSQEFAEFIDTLRDAISANIDRDLRKELSRIRKYKNADCDAHLKKSQANSQKYALHESVAHLLDHLIDAYKAQNQEAIDETLHAYKVTL